MARFPNDRPIVINVTSRVSSSITQKKRKITFRQSKKDIFKRKKTIIGVNFYDMGQIWSGFAWIDLPFSVPPVVSLGTYINVDRIELTDWNNLRDLLLTPAVADWKTYYRKLDYASAERYGLEVIDNSKTPVNYPVARNGSRIDLITFNPVTGTKWKSGGLDIPTPIGTLEVLSYWAFPRFANDATCKITITPDYTDTAVTDFELRKGDDVFLTPQLIQIHGNSFDGVIQDAEDTLWEFLIGPFAALKRTEWLSLNYQVSGYPALSYDISGHDLPGTNVTALATSLKTNPTSELWNREFEVIGPTYPHTQEPDPTVFPRYSMFRFLNVEPDSSFGGNDREGMFLAAVKRGDTVFYFWSTDTYFNYYHLRQYAIP